MQFLIRILCAISALVLATNLHAFTTLRLPYAQAHSSIKRVLFVGNSLTYVGNIPAVFSTLSSNNGHAVQADMLVQGGATLTDRLKDETLVRAMQLHHYDGIVIQERGGDLIGAFGESAQSDAEFALTSLASIAKNAEMKIIFLGSYQLNPGASRMLVEAEGTAAKKAGIPYIEISERFRFLRQSLVDFNWFSDDGSLHPGKDLALLTSVLLFDSVNMHLPTPTSLHVHAPIYTARLGPQSGLISADAASTHKEIETEVVYPVSRLTEMMKVLQNKMIDQAPVKDQ